MRHVIDGEPFFSWWYDKDDLEKKEKELEDLKEKLAQSQEKLDLLNKQRDLLEENKRLDCEMTQKKAKDEKISEELQRLNQQVRESYKSVQEKIKEHFPLGEDRKGIEKEIEKLKNDIRMLNRRLGK